MDERNKLLNRLSASAFALWELRIYLDTHPNDKTAQALFERYRVSTAELRAEYEKKFGPLSPTGEGYNEWLKDPWPWENTEEAGN